MGCSGGAFDTMVVPIDAILGDISDSYRQIVNGFISSSAFTDSQYLLRIIRPASLFVFIGMLSSACALLSVYSPKFQNAAYRLPVACSADVES